MYNYQKKIIGFIIAAVIIIGTVSTGVDAAALSSIQINEQLPAYGSIQLTVTGIYDDGTNAVISSGITWESSNTNIAIVYSNGNVIFTGQGGAVTITAKYNGISTSASVTAQSTSANPQAPSTSIYITIDGLPNYVDKGSTYYLTVQAFYNDNSAEIINNRYVTFTCSDTQAAAINSEGMVTVHGSVGGFLITAKYRDKIVTITAFIKNDGMIPSYYYSSGEMVGIKILGELPREPFQPTKLTAKSICSDGYYRDPSGKVTWTSSDSSVVNIQNDGTISYGGQYGTATITARYNNYEATVIINIDKGQQAYEDERRAAIAKDLIYSKQKLYFEEAMVDTNEIASILDKLNIASQSTNSIAFRDTKNHWAEREISLAKEIGMISGLSDSSFKPDNKISRAEFAVIVCKAFSVRYYLDSGNKVYKDVAGKWYQDYVMALKNAGIMNGYNDGTFRPDNSIARGEMIAIVSRLIAKEDTQDKNSSVKYKDVSSSYWAKTGVDKLYTLGALNKIGTNKLEPNKSATKAEAAYIIVRLFDYINKNTR